MIHYTEGNSAVQKTYPWIFTKYEVEGDLNGKPSYTSINGNTAIAYVPCPSWIRVIQSRSERYNYSEEY